MKKLFTVAAIGWTTVAFAQFTTNSWEQVGNVGARLTLYQNEDKSKARLEYAGIVGNWMNANVQLFNFVFATPPETLDNLYHTIYDNIGTKQEKQLDFPEGKMYLDFRQNAVFFSFDNEQAGVRNTTMGFTKPQINKLFGKPSK